MKWNLKLKLNLYNLYFYALSNDILFSMICLPLCRKGHLTGALAIVWFYFIMRISMITSQIWIFSTNAVVDLWNVLCKGKDLHLSCIYRCFFYLSYYYFFMTSVGWPNKYYKIYFNFIKNKTHLFNWCFLQIASKNSIAENRIDIETYWKNVDCVLSKST